MEKLKMHSPNLTDENIAKIRELFPGCVTEATDESGKLRYAVDFDQLRQELSDHIVEGPQERYRLNWPGKREALLAANTPIAKTLRPNRDESVDFDKTRNLFIEGDNLEALKLIQEAYLGRIKLIYVDPPYNTGKDFIYRDRFASGQAEQEIASGERSEEGARLVANPEGNGRFHSNWLTMITPRLRLAKNLLKRDGAIFVSCDEGEQPRLRMIMDEIFGQSNFVADMVWAAGRKNDSRLVSVSHEYIVCYARDAEYLRESGVTWRQRKKGLDEIYAQHKRLKRQHRNDYKAMTAGLKEWFRDLADGNPSKAHKHYSNIDHKGVYFAADISWPGGGGPTYEVLHPTTGKPVKVPARGWMTPDPKKMADWIKDERVHFGDDENSVPCIKKYLTDSEFQTPYSVFYQDGRAASKRLRALMGGDLFDFPKDELVLQEVIEMMTEGEDIILDFFAGSSTTAHSVMLQNAKDGGNRNFIMVQLDEVADEQSEAHKAGFKTIPEVSRERIRRAGRQILDGECHKDWGKDVGFRTLKIDTSNMAETYYTPSKVEQMKLLDSIENVKSDRTDPEDLLFQVLVDWGVDLTLPVDKQEVQGKTVFFVNEEPYDLIACFDYGVTEELVKELAKHEPARVVFRDNGFASDAVKINVEQIFKQLSPATDVKSI
ncbi:site-specific DNA-methyltransferase [Henriciella sp.]|uniref:site-specific DNA-methyltransferase n=1 Tax=Henriciella sp. TaxID=1968823 RepID=UPI002628D729|nr:site-specific DNA-methyltransferase [Henriciella sp.]